MYQYTDSQQRDAIVKLRADVAALQSEVEAADLEERGDRNDAIRAATAAVERRVDDLEGSQDSLRGCIDALLVYLQDPANGSPSCGD